MADKERIAELERKLAEAEMKANHYQSEWIVANQKLETLKKEISKTLSLDYEDFEKSKGEEYNIDIFDMYRILLKHAYKTLIKHGIELHK